MKKFLIVTLVVGLVLLQASAELAADKMKFYVVSHGGPADPFWGVVMRGAEDAGKEFDVDVTYLGPEKFSIQKLVDMVETAVADNPNGLVVTVTDAKALDEPLKDAINKGIPVVATRVGGVPDVVVDQVNGMLVDAEAPAQLSTQLKILYDNQEMRARLGSAARNQIRSDYNSDSWCRSIEALYRETSGA